MKAFFIVIMTILFWLVFTGIHNLIKEAGEQLKRIADELHKLNNNHE